MDEKNPRCVIRREKGGVDPKSGSLLVALCNFSGSNTCVDLSSAKLNHQIETRETKPPHTSDLQTAEFSRILLIKPSALGDVVHTIPVLVKLRARYPRARIDWLVTPENAEVVRHHPALSNVILFARRGFLEGGPEIARHVTVKESPICGDRNRKKDSGVAVTTHRVFPSDAPRKNHTWETHHLAVPIRDVGSAGRYESASADLRTSGVGET